MGLSGLNHVFNRIAFFLETLGNNLFSSLFQYPDATYILRL